MRYTYVGMDARRFTYQFLGELFRLRHICRVTWKAVNARDALHDLADAVLAVGIIEPVKVNHLILFSAFNDYTTISLLFPFDVS